MAQNARTNLTALYNTYNIAREKEQTAVFDKQQAGNLLVTCNLGPKDVNGKQIWDQQDPYEFYQGIINNFEDEEIQKIFGVKEKTYHICTEKAEEAERRVDDWGDAVLAAAGVDAQAKLLYESNAVIILQQDDLNKRNITEALQSSWEIMERGNEDQCGEPLVKWQKKDYEIQGNYIFINLVIYDKHSNKVTDINITPEDELTLNDKNYKKFVRRRLR